MTTLRPSICLRGQRRPQGCSIIQDAVFSSTRRALYRNLFKIFRLRYSLATPHAAAILLVSRRCRFFFQVGLVSNELSLRFLKSKDTSKFSAFFLALSTSYLPLRLHPVVPSPFAPFSHELTLFDLFGCMAKVRNNVRGPVSREPSW